MTDYENLAYTPQKCNLQYVYRIHSSHFPIPPLFLNSAVLNTCNFTRLNQFPFKKIKTHETRVPYNVRCRTLLVLCGTTVVAGTWLADTAAHMPCSSHDPFRAHTIPMELT